MTTTQTTPKARKVAIQAVESVIEPARVPVRTVASGRVEAIGRDGKPISRKRSAGGDIFHVDPRIIPEGWDYQWNPYTVLGETQAASQVAMAEAGWRPVPAERHPGMFMIDGTKGPIIRDGLMLEERPMILTEEARAEERKKARDQHRDAKETLGLSAKLPQGYSDDAQYRGAGAQVRTTLTPINDAPRPQLEIAND